MQVLPRGVRHIPGFLDAPARKRWWKLSGVWCRRALFVPEMPRTGKPMTVRMTNCGTLGWVTDREQGYRYQAKHPVREGRGRRCRRGFSRCGMRLPAQPQPPEACLVNY